MADNDIAMVDSTLAKHDEWIRATIAARLADGKPPIPHAEVMARIDATIAALEHRR